MNTVHGISRRLVMALLTLIGVVAFSSDAKALDSSMKEAICKQIEKRTQAFEDLKQKILFDLVNPVFAPPPSNDIWKTGFSPEAHRSERNFVSHMGDLGLLLHNLPAEGKEGKLKELGEIFSRAYFGGIGQAAECKDAALDPDKKQYYPMLRKNVEKRFKEMEQILKGMKKVAAQL